MVFRLLIFMIFSSSLMAGSIKLFNNTIYPLIAQIHAASGEILGEVSLKAREAKTWSNYSSFNTKQSETPYSVIWYCLDNDKTPFSVIEGIGSGSTITAMQGSGSHTCPSKKSENSNSSNQNS